MWQVPFARKRRRGRGALGSRSSRRGAWHLMLCEVFSRIAESYVMFDKFNVSAMFACRGCRGGESAFFTRIARDAIFFILGTPEDLRPAASGDDVSTESPAACNPPPFCPQASRT